MKAVQRIFRECIVSIKSEGRDRSFIFWAIAFPILLAIFFKLAFGGVMKEEFQKIEVGIYPQNPYVSIMETIDILHVNTMDISEAEKKLKEGKITGYITEDSEIMFERSGVNQTILKEVMDTFQQIGAMNLPYEKFDFDQMYIERIQQKEEITKVIFYTLIGMVSLYGMYYGNQMVYRFQGNLSPLGARLQSTPTRKSNMILAGFLVGLGLNFMCNILLLLFIRYVLGLYLLTDIWRSLVLIGTANIFGVAMGILISVSNPFGEEITSMISTVISLILSFMAGMTGTSIKIMIDDKLPILNRLNPVSIVTDNMYRLNTLNNITTFRQSIIILLIESACLLLLSYLFIRRERYDHV